MRMGTRAATGVLLCLVLTGIGQSEERPRLAGRTDVVSDNAGTAEEHPLVKPLELAKQSRKALDEVTDYEATFFKREMVGASLVPHTMHLKHRAEPFSVYLRFHQPYLGREVLYVAGKNNGNMLVRETGLKGIVGSISLSPTSSTALAESRHPITMIGMTNMLDAVIARWELELKYGEIDVRYFPNAKWRDVECLVIEASHPRPRRQFKFQKTLLYIDKQTRLPIRLQEYAFPSQPGMPPVLVEDYGYADVKVNVGLTDSDFDPRNPKYNF